MACEPTFSTHEEAQLAWAWMTVLEDPIQGNSLRKEGFWRRICVIYNVNLEGDMGRTDKSLQSKFSNMQKMISKFIGSMSKARSMVRSGWNDDNYMREALAIFSDSCLPRMDFEHVEA